ncbi:Protein bfr2 [Penicillium chermesinum]|uniref:Protein BFR2 n=1 Tax=Penicillium chermesinum TaxID=63820 RepID=A0A9W9NPQ1_9EURO|nr:Protein bfr2 [Penicillium chermesinum]KAJ5223876.1 Protein bfr2 [Penicillium chermesinum]
MAPPKGRSLADQLADLEDPTPKDFDPEDLDDGAGSSDDEGKKRFESEKGKLRKPEPVNLGKQYAGTQVSRDTLDAESDEDPFGARTDEDEDEDEDSPEELESGSEDGGALHNREEASLDRDAFSDDDSEEVDEDEESDDDEEDEVAPVRHSGAGRKSAPATEDREELRRLMATDQKTIAATISQAAKADAAKGKAVKEQRKTFDALLNTRIKLQKGLGVINELGGKKETGEEGEEISDEDSSVEAIKSAESAALALWSTLEQLRSALANAQTKDESKKRKRPSPVEATIQSSQLWERMVDLESDALVSRRATLDKWSSKVRGTSSSAPQARGKLLGSSAGQQTITAVLDANVATELGDRPSKRSRQNGLSNGTGPEPVYDDTVFYQSLLRDLPPTTSIPPPLHHVTGMRNDKNRRENVDTRASKGRKMRFNVHEKLQNFMAPEDRGSWTSKAREEFFASLLGKTASGLLGEGDDSGSDEESDEDREEGGLKLFRN